MSIGPKGRFPATLSVAKLIFWSPSAEALPASVAISLLFLNLDENQILPLRYYPQTQRFLMDAMIGMTQFNCLLYLCHSTQYLKSWLGLDLMFTPCQRWRVPWLTVPSRLQGVVTFWPKCHNYWSPSIESPCFTTRETPCSLQPEKGYAATGMQHSQK